VSAESHGFTAGDEDHPGTWEEMCERWGTAVAAPLQLYN
jgi:hypothetical protein